jgi:hypothetical protein
MTWRIGLSEEPSTHLLIADFLTARSAWKRLSKPARKAVTDAYPDGLVDAHPNTLASLEAHGFMHADCRLTQAGKECARWNVLCCNPYPAMAGEQERSCTRTLGHVDPVHRNGGDTWTHEPAESTTNGGNS